MKIQKYSFGSITIDKTVHNSDLIILPDNTIIDWWRDKSHLVTMADIPQLTDLKIELVIFGTGYYGLMKINKNVINYFKNYNIEIISLKTEKAVLKFNESSSIQKAAAFHLTC